MLHRPGEELRLINEHNKHYWLFDAVPDVAAFTEEHDSYRELLQQCGVEVLELRDWAGDQAQRAATLPNITYLHDTAVIASGGAILSRMANSRSGEEQVVGAALEALGVPLLCRFDDPDDAFEGCLLLSPQTLLVAVTERHNPRSVTSFVPRALESFEEVLVATIPRQRRYMHPDTIYNRIDVDLAIAYPPAFERTVRHTSDGAEEVDIVEHMSRQGVEIIPVSDHEQRRLACTFVPVEPRVMIHYDTALAPKTQVALARRGVELLTLHPRAMLAGGGSLRCLTLRLRREPA
jgi:arginine deiminase